MRPRSVTGWLAFALLTAVLLLFLLWEHTPSKAGNATGSVAVTAQQQAPRVVGKRSNARVRTSRLPSKARAAFGGGDGDTRPAICNAQYAFSPDTEVFGFFPQSRIVELKKPHVMADLIVEACHRYWDSDGGINSEYTYYLRDPYGNIVTEQTGDSFWFDFPADTILGEYTLTIDGAWLDSIGIFVRHFEGPRLELTDPSTGEDRTERIGGSTPGVRNTGVKAHFFGFEPESELEIGLYQVDFNAGSLEYNLIDSWLSTADSNGEYQETLDFTRATASGEYMLTACDLKECDLAFSLLSSEPFGPPNAIQVPPLAWELFNLEDPPIVSASPNASNFMRCDGPCSSNSTRPLHPYQKAAPPFMCSGSMKISQSAQTTLVHGASLAKVNGFVMNAIGPALRTAPNASN